MTDTNVWIDVHTGGLLEAVCGLSSGWHAPDLVLHELRNPLGVELEVLGVQRKELAGNLIPDLIAVREQYVTLSVCDAAALILAKEHGFVLVTGDGDLRTAAIKEGVAVHGTLWVLDHAVSRAIVDPSDAADALETMIRSGRRLPLPEVHKRIHRWRPPSNRDH